MDANGIIGLAKSGCLSLVPRVFTQVFVPPLVVAEVTDPVSQPEMQAALGGWLRQRTPSIPALRQVPRHSREGDIILATVG
jgi:hypothetical protein